MLVFKNGQWTPVVLPEWIDPSWSVTVQKYMAHQYLILKLKGHDHDSAWAEAEKLTLAWLSRGAGGNGVAWEKHSSPQH
jgi:hypothetical protein